MGKVVDSDALVLLNEALGLAGAGAQLTELDDGLLNQVLAVNRLVGRARTLPPANQGGLSIASFNIVVGASTDTVAIDPYNVPNALLYNWPSPVPLGYDIWLIASSAQLVTGGISDFGSAIFELLGDTAGDGAFGTDEGAALAAHTQRISLMAFDDAITVGGINIMTSSGQTYKQYGTRIGRGTTFSWRVTSSAGTVTARLFLVLGLFPVGLEPDVIL